MINENLDMQENYRKFEIVSLCDLKKDGCIILSNGFVGGDSGADILETDDNKLFLDKVETIPSGLKVFAKTVENKKIFTIIKSENEKLLSKIKLGLKDFIEADMNKIYRYRLLLLNEKERIEYITVKNFLINEGVIFNESDILKLPENNPADVFYKSTNQKFQITTAPAEEMETVGRLKKEKLVEKYNHIKGRWICGKIKAWDASYDLNSSLKYFILDPIENKKLKAQNDIVLLVSFPYSCFIGTWNKKFLEDFIIEKQQYFKDIGFKEIYLAEDKTTLKIFPFKNK